MSKIGKGLYHVTSLSLSNWAWEKVKWQWNNETKEPKANTSQIWQHMRRIEALFWLLGTRTTASDFGIFMVRPWWGPESRRPKEVLKRIERKSTTTEQPDDCSRLVWFDAQMVPFEFYHARGWSRKNVTFRLRRSERFSFPHPFSLVTFFLNLFLFFYSSQTPVATGRIVGLSGGGARYTRPAWGLGVLMCPVHHMWPLCPLLWSCPEPDCWPLYHVGVSRLSFYKII